MLRFNPPRNERSAAVKKNEPPRYVATRALTSDAVINDAPRTNSRSERGLIFFASVLGTDVIRRPFDSLETDPPRRKRTQCRYIQ